MGNETKIGWTDATWNPWVGCAKVHPGCAHCYAESTHATWLRRVQWGPGGTRQLSTDETWKQLRKLETQAITTGAVPTVFVASIADIFEKWPGQLQDEHKRPLLVRPGQFTVYGRPATVTDEAGTLANAAWLRPCNLDDALGAALRRMTAAEMCRFLLLTKRPQLIRDRLAEACGLSRLPHHCIAGTSISDQETAEVYGGALRDMKEQGIIPKAFLSYEPALGPVDWASLNLRAWCDWLIAGGESDQVTAKARPCRERWLDEAQDAAARAGIPFFRKQAGSFVIDRQGRRVRYKHPKGEDMAEWPLRQQVQQRLFQPDGTFWRP